MNVTEFNKLGFITGADRSELGDLRKTHLYRAEKDKGGNYLIMSPTGPLCQWDGIDLMDFIYGIEKSTKEMGIQFLEIMLVNEESVKFVKEKF